MFVYILRDYYWDYKIWLTNNIIRRLDSYKLHHARPLTVICIIETHDARIKEKELHIRFKSKWISWEWFSLNDNDIDIIIKSNKNILPQKDLDIINQYLSTYHYNSFSAYSREEEISDCELQKTIWLLD